MLRRLPCVAPRHAARDMPLFAAMFTRYAISGRGDYARYGAMPRY